MLKIEQLQKEEMQTVYETRMVYDFEKEELKPLKKMIQLYEKGIYFCYGLYEDGVLQAYACLIAARQNRALLLDYYAVCSTQRSRGYGSRFLQLLAPELSDFSFLIAEVEDPRYFNTPEEQTVKLRRIAFYEKNGLYKTGLTCTLFGHRYTVMLLSFCNKREDDQKVYDALQTIYHSSMNSRTYKKNVFLKRQSDV